MMCYSNNKSNPDTMRLYQLFITRIDRASLPSGSAIGFSTTISAECLEQAEQMAAERIARHSDASRLFVERIKDVTP